MPSWAESLIKIVAVWVAAVVIRLVAVALVRRAERNLVKVGNRVGDAPVLSQAVPSDRLRDRAATLSALGRSVITVVVFSVAVLVTLAEVGVNVTALVAGAGLTAAALAFGAQSLVRDVLTGIFMILEDEYGVGDLIDVGPCTGTVEGVSLRTTCLRDAQGRVWWVPNGEIKRVANLSQLWVETWFDVPIAVDADVAAASAAITGAAVSVRESDLDGLFLAEPQVLGVQDVTDDRVILRLAVKTTTGREAEVQRAVRAALLRARVAGEFVSPDPGPTHVVLESPPG